MDFVNTFKEKKQNELNGLKEQSATLKEEIKILNKTIGQIDSNLVFYDNFVYAYQEIDVKDSSFDEFLGYSKKGGYDLKNCSINEALTILRLYYSENGNEDKDINLFSFLDYIRQNNKDYKDMSDEKFAEEVNIARTDFASMTGWNGKLMEINDTLYKMMDIDYFYMNEEEKKAYGVILAKEGKERADYYLEVIEERSLNARKGMEEGYKTFKNIVSSPGKLMEIGTAFMEGGWSGLAGYCDHIYSITTGDYKMTVNDYASQTVQQLFQTMILSYTPVDHSTIDEFEKEYGLDAVTANNLRKTITERAYKGEEELRYYELLGYISPDDGGLTEEEVKEYEKMFKSIDGGEFYTKYVLKSAYSAGVSTGNMIPSVALGMIPVVGPYLAKISFWASAAGGTYREQRRNGASWGDAMLAGAIDGALEVGTEYFVGGIPGLSKNAVGIGDFLKMPFAQKALFMGKEILGEEIEETLQLFGGDYLLSKITGDTYALSDKWEQLPETLISTFMSTLALNSLTYGSQTAFVYGNTMINLTANDWANLYNEGFNAINFKKMLDNKVDMNLRATENDNPLNDIAKVLKENGLKSDIGFKNGKFIINGIEYTAKEFGDMLTIAYRGEFSNADNATILKIIRMANNFSKEERLALDKINPNWEQELNVFEARELLNNNQDVKVDDVETKTDDGKVDVRQIEGEVETTTETAEEVVYQEEQDSKLEENIKGLPAPEVEQDTESKVETLDVNNDDKVDVEQTENQENVTEQQEVISQEEQDRKLAEKVESLNAPKVEQDLQAKVENLDTTQSQSLLTGIRLKRGGFDESTTYGAYKQENIFKTSVENINNVIEKIKSINPIEQVLIELNDTRGLSLEILDSIPDNVDIRVIGSYTEEYFKGLKFGNQNLREKATYSKSELHDILTKIESIEKGINPNWNQYEVALYIYEYLKKNMVYTTPDKVNDGGGMTGRSRNFDSLIGLVNQISTCNGFALIYQELLTRQGIECVNVGGKYLNGTEGQHAWNIVTIDGNSFIVDSIWDCQAYENGINHTTGFGTVKPNMYSPRSYYDLSNSTINLKQEDVNNMLTQVSSSVPTTIDSYDDIIERFESGLEEGRARIDELVNGKKNVVETLDINNDDKVDVEQTENQENVTEQQEVISQEEQDRKLEESIEELSVPKVEQDTEAQVETLDVNNNDKVDIEQTENKEEIEENVKLIQQDEYFDYETDYYVVKKNFIEKISHLVKLRNLSNSLKNKLQNYLNTDSEFVELKVHDLYEILASMNTRFSWDLEECIKIFLEDKEFGTRYKELYDILTDYSKKTKGTRHNNLYNHRLADDLLTSIYEKLFHEDTNNFLNGVVSNNVNEFLNCVIEFLEIENKMSRKNDILKAKDDLMSNLSVILSAEEYEEVARQFDEMINTIPIDLDKVMNFLVEKQKLIIEDWKFKVTNPDDFVPGQPFRFICHSTTSPEYKGDFTYRYVSTSLLTEEFYDTYHSGFGFIFSPDDITSAMPYDTNTMNSADSADELFFYTTVPTIYSMDKLLEAMRVQRAENRQKQSAHKVYSELVIDGFNPTAIFCFTDGSLSYNQNYRNAKKLQAQFPNLKIIEIDLTLYDNFNYSRSSFAYLLRQLNDGVEIPEYQLDSYKPFFEEFMAMKKSGTYTEEDIKNLFNKHKYLVSDIRERDIFSGKLSAEEMRLAIKYNYRISLESLLKGERSIESGIYNIEEYKENPILLEVYPGLNTFIDMYRDGIITEGYLSNVLENNNVTSFQDIVDITLKNVENRKQELLKQLEELRATKSSIESEINSSKDKINSRIEEIQKQINANESRIKEIDEILENASAIVFNQYDYNFLKEREERLQPDIKKLEDFDRENQLLNDKLTKLKEEQEEIVSRKQELEQHWYRNRKQIQELATKLKNISAEISKLESSINSNNDDISMQFLRDNVNREKLSLQKAIQEFEEKTGVKYEEYPEQLQKALKLTEFDFEHKDNDNLRTEQSNLRMQISNLEFEIDSLQREMDSYFFETENKNKANEIDRHIKSLEKRLADLENSSKYQVETLDVNNDDKVDVEQTEEVETLTETEDEVVSQEEQDSKLEESIEGLSAPKVEQDTESKVETLDISEYKVFKSEEELPAQIFENKKYINIFGDLADGYSLNEIYQTSSETKRSDIDSLIKVLQENGLDLDMALTLYRYSIGSNIILGIKRGTASKKSIFENIKLKSKESFIQRGISQEMIATIDNFVRNLDYSLPLYKNYQLTKEFFMKQGLSNKQISSILTYVKDINSLYHVDYTIAKLDEILNNTTLQEPMVLYRAVNSSYLKQYLNSGESLTELVGKTISETGYLSTSPLYDKSLSGQSKLDLVYEIYTPDGTKGVDVTPFSGYEGAEIEYLLAPTNLYVFEVIPNVVDKKGNTKTICRCTTDKSLMEAMINSKQVGRVNDLETKTDDGVVDVEQTEEQENLDEEQLDSYKPTDEVLMRDKKVISDNVKKFVDTILSEYGDNIPQNIKDYLKSINIEDIVHIDNTGTISLYVSDGEIYLPKNAYNVLSLVSKIPGFGKLKNHVTHNQDNMIINNNTFLNFISHVFLKGLTPQEYFAEIALHETLHLCGSDGAFALFEGLTEFKTREIAQKYGLETSCCGYPKETRIIYELQQLFGKNVMDKITFADGYSKKYQIIYDSLGETEAELFKNIFVEMQLQFEPYISKKYPGVFGILDKCYQYSKIDYSKVYDMINAYRESKGLPRVSFEESLQTKKVIDKIKSIFGNMQTSNNTTNLSDEVMLNQLAEILNAVEDIDNNLDVNDVSNNDTDDKIMEEISSQLSQHNLPKLMELVNSLKSISSKLVSTLEILHYCSNALVSNSQAFETLLSDLLASATDEDLLNALKSNKVDYYSDVEGILELLSPEYKLKAFELGILKEDTIFKTILDFETNQLKIESLKYLKESRNIVDVIDNITAETKEETDKLRISALSYLKNDMDKVSIIKILSSQNKVQETLALSDIEAQLNIIETMTNEEKFEVFKNTNSEKLKINILLRNATLIDNSFLNTLPSIERELVIDTLLENLSDIIDTYVNNGTIKYYRKFFNNLKEKILSILSTRRNYFETYSDLYDGFYGADQNATRKYVSFEILTNGFFDLDNHLEELRKYLLEKFSSNEYAEEVRLKNEKGINDLINKISSHNGKLDFSDYEMIVEYLAEYVNGDKNALQSIINQTFKRVEESEYNRLMDILKSYGITDVLEARKVLDCLDTTGMCSYADIANIFFDYYKNNPEQFKTDFGYSMTTLINNNTRLNSSELLLEMYMYFNSNLFKDDNYFFEFDGEKFNLIEKFKNSEKIDTSRQVCLSTIIDGILANAINQFLKYKNIPIEFETTPYEYKGKMAKNREEIITKIANSLENGNVVSLAILSTSKTVNFINNSGEIFQNTKIWSEGGGHAVFVTGLDSNYIYVSTWGYEAKIPIEDLVGNHFIINVSSLKYHSK